MVKLSAKSIKGKKKTAKLYIKRFIIAFAALLLFSSAFGVSAFNYRKAADYKKQAEDAAAECETVKQEIEQQSELINGKGFDEYCEKIAREKYGYAKPGEYIIYDSSFGN